jgi:N6-L-threonylcarbamoyladenine synthase
MKILSIETSCDETAVSVIDARGTIAKPRFKLLGNALYSQAKLHEKYGGVFPNLAKREHAKNLPHLLQVVLKESGFWTPTTFSSPKKISGRNLTGKKNLNGQAKLSEKTTSAIYKILEREKGCAEKIIAIGNKIVRPKIDVIAVTYGPGLEPTLWVGITVAQALGTMWNIPVVPVNHMEGHIVSVLFSKAKSSKLKALSYPALALLISGGHTELVYARSPLSYKTIGATRDDAVGECYDKVARMMGLHYPGGPEISKLAKIARIRKDSPTKNFTKNLGGQEWNLPRPMINTKDFDFSFSGLKTSVLYKIRDHGKLSGKDKEELAKEFEDAVRDVLVSKTERAITKYKPKSLMVGGGVIANSFLRESFRKLASVHKGLSLYIPEMELSTDNSVMIGMAGYLRILKSHSILQSKKKIVAQGNLLLT